MNDEFNSEPAERPRIAHVGPSPDRPGGMAAVLREVLASPLASRYRLEVIATYRTRDPVRRVLVFAKALFQLARWCRGEGPRLVHIHTAVRGSLYRKSLCVVVAAQARRPVLLHLHAGAGDIDQFAAGLGPIRRSLLGRAMGTADCVVSVSGPGARSIERAFGVRDVIAIPNAAPSARQVDAARPPDGAPNVLYMGGFVNPAKGGSVMVKALPELVKACPRLEIVLAGTGDPPPELRALERTHPRVTWRGWLDAEAKAEALSRCDVFVMPSLSEGMPVALLEAMAYGRAVVASDVGGIPDVVERDAEALLVPASDPTALSTAVIRALTDAALRERLGRGARERAAEFGSDKVYERIAAVYEDLLARARPAP